MVEEKTNDEVPFLNTGEYPPHRNTRYDSCIVLYYVVLYCILLYIIVLYCISLYCIVDHFIVLYCIVT